MKNCCKQKMGPGVQQLGGEACWVEWKVESWQTGAQHEGAGTMQRRQGPEVREDIAKKRKEKQQTKRVGYIQPTG